MDATFKGTQGDWQVVDTYDENGKIIVWNGDEQAHAPVCDFGEIGDMNYYTVFKDAKLIAAAPTLFGCLEEAVAGLEWKMENQPTLFDKADNDKLTEWKKLITKIL